MTKTTKPLKISRLEKILTAAGLILVALAVIAGVFDLTQNLRFIHLPIDVLFYLGNAVVIGGGFGVGYLLFKRRDNADAPFSAGMNGLAYGLAGYMIFILIDQLRVLLNPLIDQLDYPLPAAIFSGMSLIALLITVVVCFALRKLQPSATKWLLISLFVLTQISTLNLMVTSALSAETPNSFTAILMTILSKLTSPPVVVAASYLVLRGITPIASRIFYSIAIGLLPTIAGEVAWSFRTNPTIEATEIFANTIGILMLLALVTLLLLSRRATR